MSDLYRDVSQIRERPQPSPWRSSPDTQRTLTPMDLSGGKPRGAHARRISRLVHLEAVGGRGHGLRGFAAAVEELSQACGGSTPVVFDDARCRDEGHCRVGDLTSREDLRRSIAAGEHITTLVFSERGSRSQFWAPVSRLSLSNESFVESGRQVLVTAVQRVAIHIATGRFKCEGRLRCVASMRRLCDYQNDPIMSLMQAVP
jgi:hypothetical protein